MDKVSMRIVLTGGPGGGKSDGLAYLKEALKPHGIRMCISHEVASQVIGGGVDDLPMLRKTSPKTYWNVQKEIFRRQLEDIERNERLAACFTDSHCVVKKFDRGVSDNAAYLDDKEFIKLCGQFGKTPAGYRMLYDAVIYLRTAAYGAEHAYTTENNKSRYEKDPKDARQTCDRTLQSWTGHPNLWIIPSYPTPEEKFARLTKVVLHVLGIPKKLEIERKYLLNRIPRCLGNSVYKVTSQIEQTYLLPSIEGKARVRKETQDGTTWYTLTCKTPVKAGSNLVRNQPEREISAESYAELLHWRDVDRRTVKKFRHYFAANNRYWVIDELLEPAKVIFMETEFVDPTERITLPSFVRDAEDVTDNPRYSTRAIAKRGLPKK
ncbi:MAG: AAA family ATPase [bacterium]|nr:AAA family ATPase [bacterium]